MKHMTAKLIGRASFLANGVCAMKTRLALLVSIFVLATGCMGAFGADRAAGNRETSFDSDWRFLRADAPGAEAAGFDDAAWRLLDLPHDWSIEDLPSTNGAPPSPFNPALSAGGAATDRKSTRL